MKQSIEQRREHHQTREDRQRNAFDAALRRIRLRTNPRTGLPFNVEAAGREAENIARKLNITV